MRIVKTLLIVMVVCSGLFLSSCRENNAVYLDMADINPNGWLAQDKAVFEVPVQDTGMYKIVIALRHTDDYRYSNLFLRMRIQQPDGAFLPVELVDIQLASNEGQWMGDGSGVLFSRKAALPNDFHFSEQGIYTIDLEQYMRDNPLMGLESIGLIIEKK